MRLTPRPGRYAAVAVLLFVATSFTRSTSAAGDGPTVLENNQIRLEIAGPNGVIARIVDKSSGIALAPPAPLADNFRLVLELSEKKTVTILGKDQKLSGIDRASEGLCLRWDGPLRDVDGAEHKIAVRLEAELDAGALSFCLHCNNASRYKILEVLYPMVGGLSQFGAPGKPSDGVLWIPTSEPLPRRVELPFAPVICAYPGQAVMSFTCVQSAAAGKSLYFASHDRVARYKRFRFEERVAGGSKDVFALVEHLPHAAPGKTFDGSPVVLRLVDGDWRAGGKVYRDWFEHAFGICQPSQSWIRRQSFFQMTMFELPEGTINLRYKDIPRWGKEAKEHGINAVQISGWHLGGHDNGYPYYVVDPRLGTWEELKQGIQACHDLGLKVFFFVNYQQVMLDSDWYKSELSKYREVGLNGALTWNTGWGMGTLWARMGHPKLMTGANLAFPQYRKIIVDQFARLAEIGADGVHVDKMFPAAIDYNPDTPLTPDTATWEGAILLTKEVMAACRRHNPDWAMSFECNWDRMLEFCGATWWVGNQRATRLVFPENVETLVISSPYDYLGVNNAVRDGHAVMLAPAYFCRSVGWAPWGGLADYIREVKRIQDQLIDTVFLGEVQGHEGVELSSPPVGGVDYSVFRNRATGKRGLLLTNSTMEPKTQAIARFAGGGREVRVHTPFEEAKVLHLPSEIKIPAERIVFVEELGGAR